jgi:uncharacterized protein YpmB
MGIIVDIMIWILKAIFASSRTSFEASQNMRRTRPKDAGAIQAATSTSDQKTADVWRVYRKKQEDLEAEFRAKAPR